MLCSGACLRSITSSTPAQAPEGPKEGTCAELEAKVLQQNKDLPHENHPKVKIVEVSLTPWTE